MKGHSFEAKRELTGTNYQYFHLGDLGDKLPFSLKILLENLLRHEDGVIVTRDAITSLANWDPKSEPNYEIQFMPARVLLQDFTGVPAIADLAAMRAALARLGKKASLINPLVPADLVIDHSVQVDEAGKPDAARRNADLEFQRNKERYEFLKWGQNAFTNFRVVPPDTGIVHQVNLEYLASVVTTRNQIAFPDTLIGTDSHTTMANGLGILGWGVGGIEAEAALLGQPSSMLIPRVIGVELTGNLKPEATATDLVLTITQLLRKKGVVGSFVEFFGPGILNISLADRATIANMAPEYGATMGLFPVDTITTTYMRLTNRSKQADLIETYYKAQGIWNNPTAIYSDTVSLDLGSIEPSLAGPSRPQDRVPLGQAKTSMRHFVLSTLQNNQTRKESLEAIPPATLLHWADSSSSMESLPELSVPHPDAGLGHLGQATHVAANGDIYHLCHGSVVIAAITSCTNTSNPSVLVAAGLLAKKAIEKGLSVKPWVKTSFAPGSQVVTNYLQSAGLLSSLEKLRFHVVGYGCTTCIGNSGPLQESIAHAITEDDLVVASVLSGNRNFEGRVHPLVQANYLTSPPLVVAYALAGNMNCNLTRDPLGFDQDHKPVYLSDIWPTKQEVDAVIERHVTREQFQSSYKDIFSGSQQWRELDVRQAELYTFDARSSYIQEPPFFASLDKSEVAPIAAARILAFLGDSVTTDHISPAGSFGPKSAAGKYLSSLGVAVNDYNSYGARRGNHEVMVRGTFANVRLKNKLLPGTEGSITKHIPSNTEMSIYDAAMRYQLDTTPLGILAGKEYGTGSSRDWAAKGPKLLGIRFIIAESFERIHRSNLVGMGILPLEFLPGQSATSLGLTGEESYTITTKLANIKVHSLISIVAESPSGKKTFKAKARIDTPNEIEYFLNGGILPFVLRQVITKA